MNSLVVPINKNATLKIIENQLELFCQEIIKKNLQIEVLKKQLDSCRKEKVKLARAYAKKVKVLQ